MVPWGTPHHIHIATCVFQGVLETVLVAPLLNKKVPRALWVTRGLQDLQVLQGPQGQEETVAHLETQDSRVSRFVTNSIQLTDCLTGRQSVSRSID